MIPYINRTVEAVISSKIEAKDVAIGEIIDEFKSQHDNFKDVFEALVLIAPGHARITCKSERKLTAVLNMDFFVQGFPVEFVNVSQYTWVNITRLSYGITDAEVTSALSLYGTVKSIKQEQYSNVYTGFRNALMKINTDIPPRLRITGHWCMVRYCGQKQVCFKCHSEGHKISECPQNSAQIDNSSNISTKSHDNPSTSTSQPTWYADALASRPSSPIPAAGSPAPSARNGADVSEAGFNSTHKPIDGTTISSSKEDETKLTTDETKEPNFLILFSLP